MLDRSIAPPMSRPAAPDVRTVILGLAHAGPVTNEDVRAASGLDRAAVLRALARLVDDGILVREGERRATRYRLA